MAASHYFASCAKLLKLDILGTKKMKLCTAAQTEMFLLLCVHAKLKILFFCAKLQNLVVSHSAQNDSFCTFCPQHKVLHLLQFMQFYILKLQFMHAARSSKMTIFACSARLRKFISSRHTPNDKKKNFAVVYNCSHSSFRASTSQALINSPLVSFTTAKNHLSKFISAIFVFLCLGPRHSFCHQNNQDW